MFTLCTLAAALTIATLPLVLPRLARRFNFKIRQANPGLPISASLLFLISFYLPDIHLFSETSTFQQHFVGGGAFAALLYLYVKQLLGLKHRWYAELMLLFAWISTLGAANELVELGVSRLGLIMIDTTDTSWDLLANTLGALLSYGTVTIFSKVEQRTKASKCKPMNAALKAALVFSAGTLTLILPLGIFLTYDFLTSPYIHAKYGIESTECKQDKGTNTCTITMTINNNSPREFTPDFTGTDGPGFAESGIWGVYVVNSKNEKTQESPDREAYGMTIPPHTTVKVPITVELQPNIVPKEIIIFDRSYKLTLTKTNGVKDLRQF